MSVKNKKAKRMMPRLFYANSDPPLANFKHKQPQHRPPEKLIKQANYCT
jgi:hypothetical protein